MKILLLGKDGQVGWELQRALAPLGELRACGRAEADPEMLEALATALRFGPMTRRRLRMAAGLEQPYDPAAALTAPA